MIKGVVSSTRISAFWRAGDKCGDCVAFTSNAIFYIREAEERGNCKKKKKNFRYCEVKEHCR